MLQSYLCLIKSVEQYKRGEITVRGPGVLQGVKSFGWSFSVIRSCLHSL